MLNIASFAIATISLVVSIVAFVVDKDVHPNIRKLLGIPFLFLALGFGLLGLFSFLKNNPPTTDSFSSSQSTKASATPIIGDGDVFFSDEFAVLSEDWGRMGNIVVNSGYIELSGGSGISFNNGLSEGEGMVFLLKSTQGEFNVYLANQSSISNRYIGIKTNTGYDLITSVGVDDRFIGGESLNGDLSFSPNKWYFILIQILKDGDFFIRVWGKDDPNSYQEKYMHMGNEWGNQSWHPNVNSTMGIVAVDAYQVLEFK